MSVIFLAPQCKPINDVLVNGSVNFNGTHASFRCDAGYTLQGPKTISCINGSWIPSKPSVCVGNISLSKFKYSLMMAMV